MAHLVNRRGYWSLEDSFRDECGRPRKRVLSYFGRIDWKYTLKGDGWNPDWEKELLSRVKASEKPVDQKSYFTTGDKVLVTEKASGENMVRFVYQSPKNGLMLKDPWSGIPRTVSLDRFDLELIEKNSPDAPQRGFDINSPEMIALEEAEEQEAKERLEQGKTQAAVSEPEKPETPTDPTPTTEQAEVSIDDAPTAESEDLGSSQSDPDGSAPSE